MDGARSPGRERVRRYPDPARPTTGSAARGGAARGQLDVAGALGPHADLLDRDPHLGLEEADERAGLPRQVLEVADLPEILAPAGELLVDGPARAPGRGARGRRVEPPTLRLVVRADLQVLEPRQDVELH